MHGMETVCIRKYTSLIDPEVDQSVVAAAGAQIAPVRPQLRGVAYGDGS